MSSGYDNGSDLFGQGSSAGGNSKGTALPGQPVGYPTENRGSWGGSAATGYVDDNGNPVTTNPGGRATDVQRYRDLGGEMYNRQAPQVDYGQLQYGQGQAQQAIDLQRNAAMGNAPSAAEIAGKSAMEQSLNNQVAAAGSVRGGPLAQAQAYRTAAGQGAQNQAQMTAGIQAGRANEMAQARGQYGATALGYGNQALQQTGQQIQNEHFQRGLNQQNQQYYEGLGFGVNQAQLGADLGQQQLGQDAYQFGQNMDFKQDQANWQHAMDTTNTATSFVPKGGTASDVRAKKPALLAGADSRDRAPAWLRDEQARYNTREDNMLRAQRGEYVGDINRKNPYDEDPRQEAALDSRAGNTMGDRAAPPDWLSQYQGREIQRNDPYAIAVQDAPPPPSGAAGAPRGYAAQRAGQPGSLFYGGGGGGSTEDSPDAAQHKMDPYSASIAYSDDRTKNAVYQMGLQHGAQGAPPPAMAPQRMGPTGPPIAPNPMMPQAQGAEPTAAYGGMAGAARPMIAATPGNQSFAYSDDRTKLQAAFKEGQAALAHEIQGHEPAPLPAYFEGARMHGPAGLPSPQPGAEERRAPIDLRESAAGAYGRAEAAMEPGNLPTRQPHVVEPRPPRLAAAVGSGRGVAPRDQPSAQWRGPVEDRPGPETAPRKSVAGAPTPREEDHYASPNPDLAYSDERLKEDANRRLKASPYSYKEGYRPNEQSPDEINYGPMAQEMEKNPITATTIKKDPGGMRMVDMHKLAKVHSGSIANLQEQIDDLKYGHGR